MLLFALQFVVGAILIFPLREICRKLGRNPALSFIAVIPVVGLMGFALILAFGRWPSLDSLTFKSTATS